MFASEGLMDISGKTVRRIKNINTRYEVKNQILSGLYKISVQNCEVFGYRDFLKFYFLNFEFFDLKIRAWVFARFLENHLRIPSRGYLMVQIIFQNFKFQFLSTTMKFPKKIEKFSSWSKKFKCHRKLNDGSPGYWEKYFGVGNMFLRYFKLHLKIFLEAHFFTLQELVRFSKNHCRHILWNFELKRSPSMQNRKFYFIKCHYFFDPANRWFLRRGLAFVSGHPVTNILSI